MNEKNYYFIEGTADKDIIGFDSYKVALKSAINNGSKFIGLVSDFGTGKSSLIEMLNKSENKNYEIISINLWNCNNKTNNQDKMGIHNIFLHQLINKLSIKSSNYYKKMLDKNYGLFDIKGKKRYVAFVIILFSFYLMVFFNKFELISLFNNDINQIIFYFLLALLTIFCIMLCKPLIAFRRDDTLRSIDENDTKDLYVEIIDEYFSKKKNKNKKLIICLEELDRYENNEVVINYIKEFYKFYKLIDKNVVFIIAIKPAYKYKNSSKTKDIYEKVFDFILNLNKVSIYDYDAIVINLLRYKKNSKPEGVPTPNVKNVDKWRYLYLGKDISIRDIKHRYNFAMSLYESAKSSGVEVIDFYKCLYIAYLEDEWNGLYKKLISDNNLINKILIEYTNDTELINITELKNKEKEIIKDGIIKKYIAIDYMYYFFKFPRSKRSFNIYELNVYNSIFFNEFNSQLKDSIAHLSDDDIKKLLSKKLDPNFFPSVIFENQRLLENAYALNKKTFMNTLIEQYDLVNNFEKFSNVISKIYMVKKSLFNEIMKDYFSQKELKLIELSTEERNIIRTKLVKLFKNDSLFFKRLFSNDNNLISIEEMNYIDNISVLYELTDMSKINSDYVNRFVQQLNAQSKTKIMEIIMNLSKNQSLLPERYYEIFFMIDFQRINLNDSDVKKIYNYSIRKINLDDYEKFTNFIHKIDYYSSLLDNKYLKLINSDDDNQIQKYIEICNRYSFVSDQGIDKISETNKNVLLNDNMLLKMFECGHYDKYVELLTFRKKELIIEPERLELLGVSYIKFFMSHNSFVYKVSQEMIDYLYNYCNKSGLSASKLFIFKDKKQKPDVIEAVLNTNDKEFINNYLSCIKDINNRYRKQIFEKLGIEFRKDYFSKKTITNLGKLCISKEEKNLFKQKKARLSIQ